MSPVPHIDEVARQPAGQEEYGVDANVIAVAGKAGRKALGGDRDPAQPILVEGHRRAFFAAACLDLDKGDGTAATRDQVDLAAWHAGPPGQDPPAVQAQPPCGQPLRAAAALLGNDAPVQRLSSSARA